ncbi:3-deoxy-7-phosphoheptulonate synthase [Paludibacterium yongneupense]|uniref:3-deoxy-7-phosphoheptulonate synthase n=1 Tax=Paludibacterium yongneupense TaxID=400061 RepID=UPI000401B410|nr:3-deoxy-7-phosphoheptulonate synthase [Paludibacterium yongneupense]
MIILMARQADEQQIEAVVARIRAAGLTEHVSRGSERILIGAIGDERTISPEHFEQLPGVERAMRVLKEYRMIAQAAKPDSVQVRIRDQAFGGAALPLIAGPGTVESSDQMAQISSFARGAGCRLLHGGAFAPNVSPYRFQGMGAASLEIVRDAARTQGMSSIAELIDSRHLDSFLELDIDAFDIGGAALSNPELLKEVGRLNRPVVLRRPPTGTLSEWLLAAERIAAGGNHRIVFCESGVRSPGDARLTLDLGAIGALKQESYLPVIVDPTRAALKPTQLSALSCAAIAAGADGLVLRTHPDPHEALIDAEQSLSPSALQALVSQLQELAPVVGRALV